MQPFNPQTYRPTKVEVVASLRREIEMRKRCYPKWIGTRGLNPITAAKEIKCMEMALELIAGKPLGMQEAKQANLFTAKP